MPVREALLRAAGALSAGRLLLGGRAAARGAIVMTYHDIGDDPSNTTDFYVSPRRMREQLLWARSWGARFVELHELTGALLQGRSVDGMVAVCFDDSLVGVHHHAMPILVELGIPATVFTVTSALGEDPPWWPGAARVMTRAELGEWCAAGLQAASHTRTHASLPDVSAAYVTDEVIGSRHELEDLVQAPPPLFAYPYGHYDPRAVAAAREAGYCCAFSFLNGRITPADDRFRLPRLNMWSGQDRRRLAYHLARPAGSWPDHQLERSLGQPPPNLHTYGDAHPG